MRRLIILTLSLIWTYSCNAQENAHDNKSGTIKVKKSDSDTNCIATFMGYSGKNLISKKDLLKANRIELNKKCNCEIISFQLSYFSPANCKISQDSQSDTFDIEIFRKNIAKMNFLKFDKIIAKNINTGEEISLPKIIFTVID